MLFNKRMFKKINDKKVLHKIGKQWVTISAVVLGMLGGGAVVTTSVSHAASIKPAKNNIVKPQKQQNVKPISNNKQNSIPNIIINPDGLPSTPKNATQQEINQAINTPGHIINRYSGTKQAKQDDRTLANQNAKQSQDDINNAKAKKAATAKKTSAKSSIPTIVINPDGLPSTPKDATPSEVDQALNTPGHVIDHYSHTKQASKDNHTLEAQNNKQAEADANNAKAKAKSNQEAARSNASTARHEATVESIGASADDAIHSAFQKDIKSNEAKGEAPSSAARNISPKNIDQIYANVYSQETKALVSMNASKASKSNNTKPNKANTTSSASNNAVASMANSSEATTSTEDPFVASLEAQGVSPLVAYKVESLEAGPSYTYSNLDFNGSNNLDNADALKPGEYASENGNHFKRLMGTPSYYKHVISINGDWLYNNVLGGRDHHVANIRKGEKATIKGAFLVNFKGSNKMYLRLEVQTKVGTFYMTGNQDFAKLLK